MNECDNNYKHAVDFMLEYNIFTKKHVKCIQLLKIYYQNRRLVERRHFTAHRLVCEHMVRIHVVFPTAEEFEG